MARVVFLALDAMGAAWFDRHVAAGRWPNLAAFGGEYHRLDLRSMGGSLHGSIWPTFGSGRDPA
jgi:hypothetical protein